MFITQDFTKAAHFLIAIDMAKQVVNYVIMTAFGNTFGLTDSDPVGCFVGCLPGEIGLVLIQVQ